MASYVSSERELEPVVSSGFCDYRTISGSSVDEQIQNNFSERTDCASKKAFRIIGWTATGTTLFAAGAALTWFCITDDVFKRGNINDDMIAILGRCLGSAVGIGIALGNATLSAYKVKTICLENKTTAKEDEEDEYYRISDILGKSPLSEGHTVINVQGHR